MKELLLGVDVVEVCVVVVLLVALGSGLATEQATRERADAGPDCDTNWPR